MKKILTIWMLLSAGSIAYGQRVLTLDSCRALALRNNKPLNISKLSRETAELTHKAVKTKYLPKLEVAGTYQLSSREISILNSQQKATLSNMGTSIGTAIGQNATSVITELAQKGVITADQASLFGSLLDKANSSMSSALNETGQRIRDAFRTNTRNIFGASAIVTQPIYIGGAITAANKMAEISEQISANQIDAKSQSVIYDTDQAYWLVVSLRQKQKLADSYLRLVSKFGDDVKKMIEEGVATRADGLRIDVRYNEAEMTKTQVNDGLVLAKMYLCQLCGIPLEEDIILADEEQTGAGIVTNETVQGNGSDGNQRPELKILKNAIDLSKWNTKLIRSAYLPQVMAIGGYTTSNPNTFNGFERKFDGFFHIGLMMRVPVWNWFEGRYKTQAAKTSTRMAELEFDDVKEKIELQISQSSFKVKEAKKKLLLANKSVEHAEENLRCANLGFKEGVMPVSDVMSAQTAWQQAHSQQIDAEIEVILSQVNYKKALGLLQY